VGAVVLLQRADSKKRFVVVATVWVMGLAGVLGSVAGSAGSASALVAVRGGFTSLAPARLLDTRTGIGSIAGAVGPGGTVHLQVASRGGVPNSLLSAVVLNVTVTEPTAPGFVRVYADGATMPDSSNLNYVAGQTVPNLVITPVSPDGKVALYNGSPGTVQLIADVSGYYNFGAPTVPGTFGALAPARLLDTRSGIGAGTGAVAPGGTVHLQVLGRGGVPATGVSAVALNVTATEPTSSGFVRVYGDGGPVPDASSLNYVPGQTVPNLVIAPVGANGMVALQSASPGTVQLVADASGYFLSGDPSVAGAFGALAPARLLDTRSGLGASVGAVAPGGTVHLQVLGRGGVPATGVSAVVLNVTVTEPTSSGYMRVFGDGDRCRIPRV
jgi:hypothetical protein